ncbi:unnamed protein product [Dimorphilus gyrociliatus]|uniref:Uncharacterized protein n=1 Tax=Dimorphilus gyrociliatus TaxID=2664684 RepID=A0A7I8VM58_9ANNE|nr:unnamed protein product [Dimorphilus gyrociliatus]
MKRINVTMLIFSGLSDPVWTLDRTQHSKLINRLMKAKKCSKSLGIERSGYGGFLMSVDRHCSCLGSGNFLIWGSENRQLQLDLLATAPVDDELKEMVRKSINAL